MSVAFPLPINVRVELWPFEVLFSTIFPLCGKQLTPFRTTLLNEEIVGLQGVFIRTEFVLVATVLNFTLENRGYFSP